MKNWIIVTLGLLTICLSCSTSWAMGDPAAGKEKSASCAACHGVDGNSVNPEWPKLAGQHQGYLVKQLTYFKDGERVNETMKGMASNLTEQDREDLAAYYSSQKVKIGVADPSLVDFGQKIYRSGNASSGVAPCMGCHGPNGAGNPASNYPALRGQNAQYIENQLRGFASGQRHNENAKKMMQILASRMTDREIRAVASYIQGLH
jgi:cytochrome c553